MQLKFLGATDQVTGSKHLLITTKGRKFLLDCGMYQGKASESFFLNSHPLVNPPEIEAIILSHAHIDHSGLIPLFYKKGFRGKVYCTEETMDVCEALLLDSANIQEGDIQYINKKRAKDNLPALEPLYTVKDANDSLKLFKPVPFNAPFRLSDEVELLFTEAGHLLGAATTNLTLFDDGKKIHLTYTGDVGRYDDLLLRSPDVFPQADYIITESTYGDRLHEKEIDAELELLNIVRHTCIEKKGKLIIPAFSLGRTQEIVFALDKMKNAGLLPPIKIYVDSPLSSRATDIMRRHVKSLNNKIQHYLISDPDPFGFPDLHYITKVKDSMQLNIMREPCIIIAASGMMEAGRIKHHLAHNISDPKNTILIVGYSSPNTLGGEILAGNSKVRIYGKYYNVNAEVKVVSAYSAHADYSGLLKFLSCQKADQVKKIFVVHGEDESKVTFAEKLKEQGFKSVVIPHKEQVEVLE